jgi:hypothetical protein
MSQTTVDISLLFDKKGFIAHPFTAAQKTLISIQKTSGFNRAKSEQKRTQALTAELQKRGLTMEDYEKLQKQATMPFYKTDAGEIYIPGEKFQAFLANTVQVAPRAVAKINAEDCYVAVELDAPGLLTGKKEPDGVFSRFVKNEESNERMLAENPFITNFTARGRLTVNEDMVKADDLKRLIEYGGTWVGLGAARKPGFGRFTLMQWDIVSNGAKTKTAKA